MRSYRLLTWGVVPEPRRQLLPPAGRLGERWGCRSGRGWRVLGFQPCGGCRRSGRSPRLAPEATSEPAGGATGDGFALLLNSALAGCTSGRTTGRAAPARRGERPDLKGYFDAALCLGLVARSRCLIPHSGADRNGPRGEISHRLTSAHQHRSCGVQHFTLELSNYHENEPIASRVPQLPAETAFLSAHSGRLKG